MTLRDKLSELRDNWRATEPMVVDIFAAVSPWATSVFPAALTGWNVATRLISKWPDVLRYPVAIIAAAAVESVGISAVHSIVHEWGKGKSGSRKLIALAGVAELYYLAAIITVNVIVSLTKGDPVADVVAGGILSTLSVVGALIIAVRAQSATSETAVIETNARRNATRKATQSQRERNATPPALQLGAVANGAESQHRNATDASTGARIAIPPQVKPRKGAETAAAIKRLRAEYPTHIQTEIAAALQLDRATVSRHWKV